MYAYVDASKVKIIIVFTNQKRFYDKSLYKISQKFYFQIRYTVVMLLLCNKPITNGIELSHNKPYVILSHTVQYTQSYNFIIAYKDAQNNFNFIFHMM